ncbi:hypothetical protein BKA56DRAFT_583472 [Ilyonectria sp. MPI-CAGE-AT-0026]|nr:hypothetical protein BKA56DRAFT_583472 [Ilyonectria sp. MPI-CAGE-AT-0026]
MKAGRVVGFQAGWASDVCHVSSSSCLWSAAGRGDGWCGRRGMRACVRCVRAGCGMWNVEWALSEWRIWRCLFWLAWAGRGGWMRARHGSEGWKGCRVGGGAAASF